jgi:hypothetical protein
MIIVTDLDHTISDAAWRDHLLPAAHATGDWDEYFRAGNDDQPIQVVLSIVRHFCKAPAWQVIGLTGRGEKWRKPSQLWLWRHGVVLDELLMRPDGDHTPTPEMKVRLICHHIPNFLTEIAAVIEDRTDCVLAFKAIGLNVLQYHDHRRRDEPQG